MISLSQLCGFGLVRPRMEKPHSKRHELFFKGLLVFKLLRTDDSLKVNLPKLLVQISLS